MYKDETYKHVKENARVENLSSSTERKEEETSRNYKLSGYFIRYERDSLRSGKMRYDYTHKTFRSGQKGVIFFSPSLFRPLQQREEMKGRTTSKKKKGTRQAFISQSTLVLLLFLLCLGSFFFKLLFLAPLFL